MASLGYEDPGCWCGGERSDVFSPAYRQCKHCGSLFLRAPLPAEHFRVTPDDQGFYSQRYWTTHLPQQYGQPDLFSRSRSDLPGRNLHWLRALVQYVTPGSRILEAGCAHGSFVALLQAAGFEALGLDLSPAVLEFARIQFGIAAVRGPIEDLSLPPGAFDVVAAMDVLEHFPQPRDSMGRLASLLQDDGIFLIQTPCVPASGAKYAQLSCSGDRFIHQLKADQHIYLFTRDSIRRFFSDLGFDYVQHLEPAFDYDMFVAASRRPLTRVDQQAITDALTENSTRRLVLALLDLDEDRRHQRRKWLDAESDRAERLKVIEEQSELTQRLQAELEAWLRHPECKHQVHHELDAHRLPSDRSPSAPRLSLEPNHGRSGSSSADAETARLSSEVQGLEADRAERLSVIYDLANRLGDTEGQKNAAQQELCTLSDVVRSLEDDRAARLEVIQRQAERFVGLQQRFGDLEQQVAELTARLEAADVESVDARRLIESLHRQLDAAHPNREREALRSNRARRRVLELEEAAVRFSAALGEFVDYRDRMDRSMLGKTLFRVKRLRPPFPQIPEWPATEDDGTNRPSARASGPSVVRI